MMWRMSWRSDPKAKALADRHYNRQSPESNQFMPPGEDLVLITEQADAVWASRRAQFVRHAWPGAWMNVLFRNEGPVIASTLIRQAVANTRWRWPEVPDNGMISFVDPRHIAPIRRRGKAIVGYSYLKAGFRHVGFTKVNNLWVWQLLPADMPEAIAPLHSQASLIA